MRNYELTLLLQPELGEGELKETMDSLLSSLQNQGAIVMSQDLKGRRSFFASQKQRNEALMATVRFTLEPSKVGLLESSLKESPELLRHLLLSWTPKKTRERVVVPASRSSEERVQPEEKKADIGDIDKRLQEIFQEEKNNES